MTEAKQLIKFLAGLSHVLLWLGWLGWRGLVWIDDLIERNRIKQKGERKCH